MSKVIHCGYHDMELSFYKKGIDSIPVFNITYVCSCGSIEKIENVEQEQGSKWVYCNECGTENKVKWEYR